MSSASLQDAPATKMNLSSMSYVRKSPRQRKRTRTCVTDSPSHKTDRPYKKVKTGSPTQCVSGPAVCQFCLSYEDNEKDLGVLHQKHGITAHYFCLLFASGLAQSTKMSDRTSINGFTVPDIEKELRRGTKLKCRFCQKRGATIGCCNNHCKCSFHLPCGKKHGTMHYYFGDFSSFCAAHWPLPNELTKALSNVKDVAQETCSVCLMPIGNCAPSQIILPPCCKRAFFHHSCLQSYAASAGLHYFRCPLCNVSKKFIKGMLSYGIHIPDRDASWERDAGAFQELLVRPDTCAAPTCVCPQGRKYDGHSKQYQLMICYMCGSYCAHRACAGIRTKSGRLVCSVCSGV